MTNLSVDVDGDAVDKNERPPIPALAWPTGVATAVANLVHSCWVREPDCRPTFSSVVFSLEEVRRLQGHHNPQICRTSTPVINIRSAPVASTESSPADEHYETASESMTTEVEEEIVGCMVDVPLTSPVPILGNGDMVRSMVHVDTSAHTKVLKILTQVSSGVLECQDTDTPTPSPTNMLGVNTRHEVNYRLIIRSNHAFHSSCES